MKDLGFESYAIAVFPHKVNPLDYLECHRICDVAVLHLYIMCQCSLEAFPLFLPLHDFQHLALSSPIILLYMALIMHLGFMWFELTQLFPKYQMIKLLGNVQLSPRLC